jgi:glycosyltransferase involved in cell wall biosynthesis
MVKSRAWSRVASRLPPRPKNPFDCAASAAGNFVATVNRRLLVVGGFPPGDRQIVGGVVSSCRVLLHSSFALRFDLLLLDSTQMSQAPPPIVARVLFATKRFMRFVYMLERNRPDAVLLFVSLSHSLVEKATMAWYSRLRGIPSLMFPRGGGLVDTYNGSRLARLWMPLAFRGSTKVLCQGAVWQGFAVRALRYAPENAPIVYNWTATNDLLRIGETRAPAVSGRVLRLIFVGWLDREKGVFELLDACRRLLPIGSFLLDLVGEGNTSVTARSFALKHGLGDIVRFHGWVSGARLHQLYREADVLVLPSWAEGFPNVVVEAMAARLAVVATAVGNIPDIICDGVSGLLVPSRNSEALVAALSRLITDADFRERSATAGFHIAREKFATETAIDKLVRAINDTICRGSRSSLKAAS